MKSGKVRSWVLPVLLAGALSAVTPRWVTADPIRIIAGEVKISSGDPAGWSVQAGSLTTGFVWGDSGFPMGFAAVRECVIGSCVPGQTFDASVRLNGAVLGNGPATYAGVSYGDLFFSGNISITTGPVIAPDARTRDDAVRFPFAMTALLIGYTNPTRTGAPLFTLQVFGNGTGRVVFRPDIPGQMEADDMVYSIEAAQPVPEPATLLLLGAGTIACAARRRRARKARVV